MAKKSLKPSIYVYPTPVLLITAREGSGIPHVATICWAGVLCSEPPTVGVSIRPIRRSNTLIRNGGDFVVNIPSRSLLAQADLCGFTVAEDVDKFSAAGFTALEASRVKAPLIKECPVNLECVVKQVMPLGSHDLFIAEVVAAHADEEVLDGDRINVEKLSPFTYSPIVHEYRETGKLLGTYGFTSRDGSGPAGKGKP